jgi:hypothetical protein
LVTSKSTPVSLVGNQISKPLKFSSRCDATRYSPACIVKIGSRIYLLFCLPLLSQPTVCVSRWWEG